MQAIGNILLIIALIAGGALFTQTFLQKMPGGDAGVGHAYATFFSFSALWISITLLVCIIGFSGSYQWLSLGRFGSGRMIALYFLIIVLGAFLGLNGSFKSIRILGLISGVMTPIVLLAASAVLLNENIKLLIPATYVKWGLGSILGLNGLILTMMLLGKTYYNVSGFISRSNGTLSDFEMGIMERIDTFDVTKGIAQLLIYSGNNQPKQIKEKAVAKIKSKPDWEKEIIKALESDYVDDAFRFLLANVVNDKPRYAKGVYQGVLSQAKMVCQRYHNCSHPSHVYDGMFGYEIRNTLKTVEKFKDLGVDFKPAMQELRAALDEPNSYGNPDVSSKKAVDKWLKKN